MNKGFTLIETMVAIFIMTIITTALFSIIPVLYRADRYALEQTHAIDEARRGIKIMLRELREASPGQDGSYIIEYASSNEIIFYSDIDQDNKTERIRYFLGELSDNELEQECVSYTDGGQCLIIFQNFFTGDINNAQLRISTEGDFGSTNENLAIFIDGNQIDTICSTSGTCQDCAGYYQDIHTYGVDDYIQDNRLELRLDASSRVNNFCDWKYSNHSFIGNAILTWDEVVPGFDQKFQRGVIDPTDDQIPEYILENEEVSTISHYIQNQVDTPAKSVFYYYDQEGNEIVNPQENLEQISLIKLKLIVNVNPSEKPRDYYLESMVKLRALILDNEE